jgi:hypothetical protein
MARQIARFRGMVMSDSQLLYDLCPERMEQLKARVGQHDGARLVEIVTVAPRPRLAVWGGADWTGVWCTPSAMPRPRGATSSRHDSRTARGPPPARQAPSARL